MRLSPISATGADPTLPGHVAWSSAISRRGPFQHLAGLPCAIGGPSAKRQVMVAEPSRQAHRAQALPRLDLVSQSAQAPIAFDARRTRLEEPKARSSQRPG